MERIEKLKRLERHLSEHPHDYQSVISRMKIASDIYDHQQEKRKHARVKQLAEIKRKLAEEDRWRETH